MEKRILVTGGTGRFGSILKNLITNYEMLFPSKTTLDITNFRSIQKYIKLKKPNTVIHLAGLSRPMNIHDRQIQKSIDLNIVGTSNITKACAEKNINSFIFLPIMYIQEQEVTTKNRTVCYRSIIMHGQSSVGNVLFKCIKNL